MFPSPLPSPSRDGISLVSSGCPRTHAVGQAGLELTDPPAFASHVLGFRPVPSEQVFFSLLLFVVLHLLRQGGSAGYL